MPPPTKVPRSGDGSLYNHLCMALWLGVIHYTIAIAAVALCFLPHPLAMAVLALLGAAAVLPNAPPYPAWGISLSRAITRAAESYFPLSLEWEDEAGYLAAAKAGTPTLIGLEPHSVLPLAIVTFGAYFYAPSAPAEVRNSRALASSTIFAVPLLRQLWSWLGMDPISRKHMAGMST
jgi:hypothetical protein